MCRQLSKLLCRICSMVFTQVIFTVNGPDSSMLGCESCCRVFQRLADFRQRKRSLCEKSGTDYTEKTNRPLSYSISLSGQSIFSTKTNPGVRLTPACQFLDASHTCLVQGYTLEKPLGTHCDTPRLLIHLRTGIACSADYRVGNPGTKSGFNFRAQPRRLNPGISFDKEYQLTTELLSQRFSTDYNSACGYTLSIHYWYCACLSITLRRQYPYWQILQ